MPAADPHKSNVHPGKSYRRVSSMDEEDIRRSRGELSCAECRRLKLKCDRNIPCGSCVRRGYSSLCPNGSLMTGQPTKPSKKTQQQKDIETAQRIQELEDALETLQATVSSEPHPLLLKRALKKDSTYQPPTITEQLARTTAAFGTLAIGRSGNSAYFGSSAGTEALMLVGADMEDNKKLPRLHNDQEVRISAELGHVMSSINSALCGLDGVDQTTSNYHDALDFFLQSLPDRQRAAAFCDAYVEHFCYILRPITREDITTDLLTPVYDARDLHLTNENNQSWKDLSPHKVAALYGIFSVGALGHPQLPPYCPEAERYHRFARAAISLRLPLETPTLDTILAIMLLSSYHANAGRRHTLDSSWTLIALASKLGQGLGLHRNCTAWNMDHRMVQRRLRLWWEMWTADIICSLVLGRPPSIHSTYMDCPFPEDTEYHLLKFRLVRDLFAPVLEVMVAATPLTYDKILQLDKKLREHCLGPSFNGSRLDSTDLGVLEYMECHALEGLRCVCSVYVHRIFFAQALLDNPENPLLSPFAPSFLAAYRNSSWVIKASIQIYTQLPELCARWWSFWQQLFNATITVGSIVTRSPASMVSATAFIELGLAVDLFEGASMSTRRARSALAILRQLRQRAHTIYSEYHWRGIVPHPNPEVYAHDELSLYGGQTRIIVRKQFVPTIPNALSSEPNTSNSASPVTPPSASVPELVGDPRLSPATEVHPSLQEQYMGFFPASAFAPGFDLNGNINASSSVPDVPHMASQLREYSYPPSAVDDAVWPPPVQLNSTTPARDQLNLSQPSSSSTGGTTSLPNPASPANDQWWAFLAQAGLGAPPPT